MAFSLKEKTIIRDCARKVAQIADSPEMEKRRASWRDHNSLKNTRPLIMAFPEGAWGELLHENDIQCADKEARTIEWRLRERIYEYEHFSGDQVIEKQWVVNATIEWTSWGLEPKYHESTQERGSWGFDPVLKDFSDVKKLKHPDLFFNKKKTDEALSFYQDLFGDILTVTFKGIDHLSFHLMSHFIRLRGLEQMFLDMYENPQLIHDTMRILMEGERRIVKQYIDNNLLSLNNDNTYQNSGGNGYTHELPPKDCTPEKIRPCDMWSSAESQELSAVSPDMHNEFALQYEKPLLEPFGLNGYGCCEDLTNKLDYVLTIPHIRRISISPWADVKACAEKLKGNYIFSWKPKPSHLCSDFNPDFLRNYIRTTIEAAKAHGCVLEIILKDTHTVDKHPERIDLFIKIARDLVTEYFGEE
jgi:hypothetical protein